MINLIVLGQNAKQYCECNNIDRLCLRDHLPKEQIKLINELQNMNTTLIKVKILRDQRKDMLAIHYAKQIQKYLK